MIMNSLIHTKIIFVVISPCMGFLYIFLVRKVLPSTAVEIRNGANRPHLKNVFNNHPNGDKKVSEYGGALTVERNDIDRLRQNKDNNRYMIEPAFTTDTNEYGQNHFKNVDERVSKYQEHEKLLLGTKSTSVKSIKSLMLFIKLGHHHFSFLQFFQFFTYCMEMRLQG